MEAASSGTGSLASFSFSLSVWSSMADFVRRPRSLKIASGVGSCEAGKPVTANLVVDVVNTCDLERTHHMIDNKEIFGK